MINMRIGQSGLFLVFPCAMIAQEFLEVLMDWFSSHTLPHSDPLVREAPHAPGPQIAGVDLLVVVQFLRKLTGAVTRFLEEEGAESTSGTPEAIGLQESDVAHLVYVTE